MTILLLLLVWSYIPHKDCSYIEKVEVLLVKDEYSDDGHWRSRWDTHKQIHHTEENKFVNVGEFHDKNVHWLHAGR